MPLLGGHRVIMRWKGEKGGVQSEHKAGSAGFFHGVNNSPGHQGEGGKGGEEGDV